MEYYTHICDNSQIRAHTYKLKTWLKANSSSQYQSGSSLRTWDSGNGDAWVCSCIGSQRRCSQWCKNVWTRSVIHLGLADTVTGATSPGRSRMTGRNQSKVSSPPPEKKILERWMGARQRHCWCWFSDSNDNRDAWSDFALRVQHAF